MSRDYAKRAQESSTSKRSSRTNRYSSRATSRPALRSKPVRSQARTRRSYKKKRSIRFPWRRILLLILALIMLFFMAIFVRLYPNKINQQFKPAAPVEEAQPINSAPVPHVTKPTALPKVNFVFQDDSQHISSNKHFMLQLGTYLPGEDLIVLNNELKKLDIHSHQHRIWRNNTFYYRVELGPFNKEADAMNTQQLLRHEKIYSVITE